MESFKKEKIDEEPKEILYLSRNSIQKMIEDSPGIFRLYKMHSKSNGKISKEDKFAQFPGLILDKSILPFSVCLDCKVVTQRFPLDHVCERFDDSLRTFQIEEILNMDILSKNILVSPHFRKLNDVEISCRHCNGEFQDGEMFKNHLNNVHDIKTIVTYICQDCGAVYDKKRSLYFHELYKHNTAPKSFICNECNKECRTKAELEHHMYVHTNERNEICEICSKTFKSRHGLRKHMMIHGEKKWPCRNSDCNMFFANGWTRKQHENLHLGIKPYGCQYCEISFTQKNSLDCHMKSKHKNHTVNVVN